MTKLLRYLIFLMVLGAIGCDEAPDPTADFSPRVLLTAAAEDGDPEAQYALAVGYGRGEFGEPDPTAFEYWLRRAAGGGHTRAQEQLGQLLLQQGGEAADAEALGWFQQAAAAGDARARYSLGVMHASGRGVPVNLEEAFLWVSLAAAQGHEAAREAQARIGEALSESQQAAVARRLRALLEPDGEP